MKRPALIVFAVLGLWPALAAAPAWANGIEDSNNCYDQFRSGNDKAAIGFCTRAIESGQLAREDLAAALINRGVAYRNLGDSKRSVVDYTEALKYAPNDGMIYANRSNALRDIGEYQRALEDADKAVELDKYRAASFFVRGAAYEALNQYEPARRDYMQALTIEPGNRDYQDHVFALDAKRARKAQLGGGAK